MSTVLITGTSTGIGRATAETLLSQGHTVYATMRDAEGRDATAASQLGEFAASRPGTLRIAGLDVTSQASADAAVQRVIDEAGHLDVVVHNAGHLFVGYTEAFTEDDLTRLLDVNAVGAHRVNRAALPHLRGRRSGTLVYVGSTILVTTPPFLGPYVASKAAFDALAVVTSYEVSQFGIETSIVMPGAIPHGTNHFSGASRASDAQVTAAYADLDALVARTNEAHDGLFDPERPADPQSVADEVARILTLPEGCKPFRSVVDAARAGVDHVMAFSDLTREAFVRRLGFEEVLELKR
ncbi:NAD(P)-dependent dehydrogenase (short-subunit alcohol dehydrogenase family) [Streptomyces sp. LBL]|jgi:NAD(P)-dependent dehydrogenase (short-subunit alcohol dehydrogenase family)|uniref:SDR family oxidoreductase n=1 Tax=Streptomyces sp. LBL TaxID=2940562 RepID=UPI002473CAB8|nr:SDR family oxidoreductase [Streptomyces sp. LBL]MDH6630411.1 NAD(P)-dependent dehydrogenase (short-subunit alcohol dehydrogenase family) [Streptomyces sp. LBL]